MTVRRRYGFTLIELLVVIAIIAILAAILFPVFAKAREKARQSSCQSNNKQLGVAMMQYVQDYDEMMPRGWFGASNAAGQAYTWRYAISPYAKSGQLFFCPSHSLTGTRWDPNTTVFDAVQFNGQASYAYNVTHHNGGAPTPPYQQALASLVVPAETIVLTDGTGGFEIEAANNAGVNTHNAPRGDAATAGSRHNEGANYTYADGHVKWLKPTAVDCSASKCDWSIEDE
ncbi:MAG: DUF1559 domain-containing protein [Armatimonadetes bacterium]|nr:DUF1559 domain-containing protein [Armatimonadota bacterium]